MSPFKLLMGSALLGWLCVRSLVFHVKVVQPFNSHITLKNIFLQAKVNCDYRSCSCDLWGLILCYCDAVSFPLMSQWICIQCHLCHPGIVLCNIENILQNYAFTHIQTQKREVASLSKLPFIRIVVWLFTFL